jgi:hypothetical protein
MPSTLSIGGSRPHLGTLMRSPTRVLVGWIVSPWATVIHQTIKG